MLCQLIIIVLGVILFLAISNRISESRTSTFRHAAHTYYDDGGWIDGPPFNMHKYLDPKEALGVTFKPLTAGGSGDAQDGFLNAKLCVECHNLCQLDVYADPARLKQGETPQTKCSKECQLLCGSR